MAHHQNIQEIAIKLLDGNGINDNRLFRYAEKRLAYIGYFKTLRKRI